MHDTITIERPSLSCANGVHRIEAQVDGAPLWFASADAPLRSSPEGWATLLLLPALHQGRRLRLKEPVCPRWAGQLDQVLDVFARWWNYPRLHPQLSIAETTELKPPRAGLCFTGGVDSFFSLLRYPRPIDALVHLVPSDEARKAPRFENHLRRVARERGMQAIVVRSNLRRHPIYRRPRWGRTHGAALAAVGHFLADNLGTLILSSSYPYAFSPPWGSHHELDPLWSSSRLDVTHFGATHWRTEKLVELADEPVMHNFLNPCSKDAARLNCSRCEKCLRTQLVLYTCGKLDRFTVFDRETPLAQQADRVRKISIPGLFCVYERLLEAGLPGDLADAVRRLLARSRRHAWLERCKDVVRRVFGRNTSYERDVA
jgi:hypothetical protein